MVFNGLRPSKNVISNFNNVSAYPVCKRGLSCPNCGRQRPKETPENLKSRSRKVTLLDAFRKAVSALDELDLVPRAKKARVCRHKPAALTIYVKKRTEKVYNAIRLNQKTVEELKRSLGDKYNFSPACVTSFKLLSWDGRSRQKNKRRFTDVTEDIVGVFQDEDDFLLDLTYDVKTGVCDVTLIEDAMTSEAKTSIKEEDLESKKTGQ